MKFLSSLKSVIAIALTCVMTVGVASANDTVFSPSDEVGVMLAQTQAQTPPNHGGYPFDYPADAGGVNKKEEGPPAPANPTKKIYEDGKIVILKGNHRHFDWKIGDRIPITMIIQTAPDVVIDFSSLLKKREISFEPTDFQLFGEPTVTTRDMPDGSKMYEVKFAVQSFVPPKVLVLNLDLRYSMEFAEDKTTRVWKILRSPDFVVSEHWTVDHGNELLEGDLKKKPLNIPWATHLALVAGVFLFLLWPGVALVKYLNRVRTRNSPPPESVAWKVFDAVFGEIETMADFKPEHYALINGALRAYFEARYGVPVESQTVLEIQDRLSGEEEYEAIMRVISLCERVTFAEESLTEDENAEIVAKVNKLVPRHWDTA